MEQIKTSPSLGLNKKIRFAEQEAWEVIMSGDNNLKACIVLIEKDSHLYQISSKYLNITAVEKKIFESFKFTED